MVCSAESNEFNIHTQFGVFTDRRLFNEKVCRILNIMAVSDTNILKILAGKILEFFIYKNTNSKKICYANHQINLLNNEFETVGRNV